MDSPLFAALFNEEAARPWSVTQLNDEIAKAVERSFANVWIEGEITNFRVATSNHWYFSLTDGASFVKAACFRNQNFRVRFRPADGMQVRVRGRLSVFGARNELQIIVESLEPVGEGARLVAFEQVKARLHQEGLLDGAVKRQIPQFPRRIGVVTSAASAAIHDILTVLGRRAASVNVLLVPTQVQGETAGEQIANAIRAVNKYCEACSEAEKIDVLIVGRGGGSAEDLWSFNEEVVARAIRASAIPVISAVGHEIDYTIADLAADLRAATPSAAAELVVKTEQEVLVQIDGCFEAMERAIFGRISLAARRLNDAERSRGFDDVKESIRRAIAEVDTSIADLRSLAVSMIGDRNRRVAAAIDRITPARLGAKARDDRRRFRSLKERNSASIRIMLRERSGQLENQMARLNALSPLNVLHRGYSITRDADGMVLREAGAVSIGDELRITLDKGTIAARVEGTAGSDI